MPHKLRTVFEQKIVSAAIARAKDEHPHFDKFFNLSVMWWLARDPLFVGKRVPGSNPIRYMLRTIPVKPLRIPAMRVLYSVTENEVIIEALAIYGDNQDVVPSPENVIKHMLNTPPPKKGKDEKENPAK